MDSATELQLANRRLVFLVLYLAIALPPDPEAVRAGVQSIDSVKSSQCCDLSFSTFVFRSLLLVCEIIVPHIADFMSLHGEATLGARIDGTSSDSPHFQASSF